MTGVESTGPPGRSPADLNAIMELIAALESRLREEPLLAADDVIDMLNVLRNKIVHALAQEPS